MNTIGESIIKLRKKHGMTQEQLAQSIGVSAQSISKWENGTNMPDILLLPVIADLFGVSVDALYGRGREYGQVIHPDKSLDECCDSIMEILASTCFDMRSPDNHDEFMTKYRSALKTDPSRNSGVFRNHGTVFYNDLLGGLAIKRPVDGWSSLFKSEEVADAMKLFADDEFRGVYYFIVKSGMKTFTLSSVCKHLNVENIDVVAEKLDKSQLFRKKQLEIDDRCVDIYESLTYGKQFFIRTIYALAKAYVDYNDSYFCLHGDIDAFND